MATRLARGEGCEWCSWCRHGGVGARRIGWQTGDVQRRDNPLTKQFVIDAHGGARRVLHWAMSVGDATFHLARSPLPR